MGRSGVRRVFILCGGLLAVVAGIGAIAMGHIWGSVPIEVAVYGWAFVAIVALLGVVWWHQETQDEIVDETAPRTVQYVYLPPQRKVIHSSVYYPKWRSRDDKADDTLGLTRSQTYAAPSAVAVLEPDLLELPTEPLNQPDYLDLIADAEHGGYERGLREGRMIGFAHGLDAELLPDPLGDRPGEPFEEDGGRG